MFATSLLRRPAPPPSFARKIIAACAVVLMLCCSVARAEVTAVRSAELHEEDGKVLLSAEFNFKLNPTLEEALSKGIALYIDLEFKLTRPRWYWVDETVVDSVTTYRLSYAPLTRQYRIGSGLLSQSFATLAEVERFIGRVTSRPVADASALAKGTRYDAALRLHLDGNQLPKPLQVSALASRDWQLSSDWLHWSFTP